MRGLKERMGRRVARKTGRVYQAALRPVVELVEKRTMFAAFTPGDLVVYRIGTGSGALTSSSSTVFIDEYSPSGSLVQSVAMPTAAAGSNNPLTASGSATSEGNLALSQDGTHLLLTGYDAVPNVGSVASTVSPGVATVTTGSISGATNALPIVLKLSSSAGMVDGQQITVSGVGGNTAANGTYYIKVTGQASSSVALYSDAALTQPVAGNGTYTANTGTWTDTSVLAVAREVGVVDANGNVNTSTTLGNALSGNNVRGAASVTGTGGIWAGGATGTVYTTAGSSANPTSLTSQNTRTVSVINNQLYISTGTFSPPLYIDTVGSGLPTTSGQTVTQVPGLIDAGAGSGVGGPYQFAFATVGGGTSPDTLYIADNYNYAVEKFSLESGSWTPTGYVGGTSSGPLNGVTGVVVEPVAGGEEVFATTPTKIYSFVDTSGYQGTLATSTALTTVATAATNEAFRGIQFTPVASPIVSSVSPSSGSNGGGTTVTITGAGFNGATAVNFGSTPAASFILVAPNEITAVAPAHGIGTVDVTVVTPQGTSATSAADQFSYTNAPVVSGLSVNAGPLAGGTSVTITGSNFTPTSTVSFGSVAASQVTYVSSTQLTAVSPAESVGTVDVKVTGNGFTSSPSNADKFTFAAAPTVTGVSPNSGPDSGGTSVTITGTGFFNGATVSFGGTAASKLTVNSPTSITAVAPYNGATGPVDVVVTSAGGTSSTSAADQFTYGVTTNAQAEAAGNAGATTVTIDNNPVVTAILAQPGTADSSVHNYAFLVNDGTGSLEIFSSSLPNNYTPTVGDALKITGAWSPYNQIPELAPTAITLVSQGNAAAGPVGQTIPVINMTTLPENVAGYLVTLNNVTISNTGGAAVFGGSNIQATITDTSGHSMTLYYWPTSYSTAYNFFNGATIPTGPVNLTGIVDVYNGTQPEFLPMYEPGVTPDKFSLSTNASSTGQPDGFKAVTRGSTITVTVTRTESADAETVAYSETDDSAVAGTDYTAKSGTLNFAVGQTTAQFTIPTAANPGDSGDRLFSINIADATGGTGYLPIVTGGPTTIVIKDPASYSAVANNSYLENATVQLGGVRHSANSSGLTDSGINAIQIENAGAGTNASFAVMTFNDQTNDPTHVFNLNGNNLGSVVGLELETVGLPESYDVSGPLNVYIAPTQADITYQTSPLTFQVPSADATGEGLGSQLGLPTTSRSQYLLGQIQYNANQAPGAYTPYNLTSLSPSAVAILTNAIKNGTPFQIVVTPANSTVSASWNASTETLTVNGPTTIIADPNKFGDEPIVQASGSSAKVEIQPVDGSLFVHLGGLSLLGGATADLSSKGSARTHNNHEALVLGTVNGAAPLFSVDAIHGSKLDLEDNDMIVHNGSLPAVQALAATGRNAATGFLDGTWTGNGLTSSVAAKVDGAAGYEETVLAPVLAGDELFGLAQWQVGSATENLSTSDVVVKYTYNGDTALEGYVGPNSAALLGAFYDNGATQQSDWAFGDLTGDGRVDANAAAILGATYGLGTGGAMGVEL